MATITTKDGAKGARKRALKSGGGDFSLPRR